MNNKNDKIIQKIIQGGAVGLAVILIFLVAYQLKLSNDLVTNHIHSSTEATRENTKVLEKLSGLIDRLLEK